MAKEIEGRIPEDPIAKLRRLLAKAVKEERYEDAAGLRDQIRDCRLAGQAGLLVDAENLADADPAIDALVLTGAGRCFSGGVDLKDRVPGAPPVEPNPGVALRALAKPVIAAIDGPCITGALEMALSCSFAIARWACFRAGAVGNCSPRRSACAGRGR